MVGVNVPGWAYPAQGANSQSKLITEILADAPGGLYLMDETTGTVMVDSGSGGVNGAYSASPTLGVTTNPPVGDKSGVTFVSASSQEATVSGNSVTTNGSWELWFDDWVTGTLLRDNTSAGSAGYLIGFISSGFLNVRIAGTTTIATSIAAASCQDGNLHQLVVTKSGANVVIYFDNVVVGSSSSAANTGRTAPWHVAKNGTNAGQYCDVTVYLLAFYTTALSAGRVAAHYNAGTSIQDVDPSGIASGEAFGTTVIGTPTPDVDPSAIASGEAFGSATITHTDKDVDPSGIGSGEAFGSATLTPGTADVDPTGIPSGEAFGAAALADAGLHPGGIGSGEGFGTPEVNQPQQLHVALDNTDPYGIDLELSNLGDLALRGRGDLSRLGGAPNVAQALVLRLRAYPGELPLHEDYGSQLVDQLVGRKQLDLGLARAIANIEARGIIEHDRRFLAIVDVTAADGGPRTLAVGLTLRLAGGEIVALDDLAETRIDEVTIDTTASLDTDLDLAALDAGGIDYDRDDLGDQPDVDLLTGIDT